MREKTDYSQNYRRDGRIRDTTVFEYTGGRRAIQAGFDDALEKQTTYQGDVSIAVGKFGSGLYLTGVATDFIDLGNDSSLMPGVLTLGAWINASVMRPVCFGKIRH